MNTEVKILMIDDREDVYQSLKNDAIDFGIELIFAETTDDAEEKLRTSKGIAGVIIDAVGLIKKGEKGGQGKETGSFLIETIRRVDYIEKEKKVFYAKCVYTSFYERFVGIVPENILVFSKLDESGADKNEMFRHLLAEVKKNDFYRISHSVFPDVFNCIRSQYFKENNALRLFYGDEFTKNDAIDILLYSLCKKVEKVEYDEELFNLIRQMLEYLLISIRDFGLPDEFYIEDDKPDQSKCLRYIEYKDVYVKETGAQYSRFEYKKRFPKIIQYCFRFLKDVSNDKSHLITKPWNKYLLISVINTFFEIIKWLSNQKKICNG